MKSPLPYTRTPLRTSLSLYPLTTELHWLFWHYTCLLSEGVRGTQNVCLKAAFQEDVLTIFCGNAQSKTRSLVTPLFSSLLALSEHKDTEATAMTPLLIILIYSREIRLFCELSEGWEQPPLHTPSISRRQMPKRHVNILCVTLAWLHNCSYHSLATSLDFCTVSSFKKKILHPFCIIGMFLLSVVPRLPCLPSNYSKLTSHRNTDDVQAGTT